MHVAAWLVMPNAIVCQPVGGALWWSAVLAGPFSFPAKDTITMRMNRRQMTAMIGLGLTLPFTPLRSARAQPVTPAADAQPGTPAADTQPVAPVTGRDNVTIQRVTVQSGKPLFGDVFLDHYRVINNGDFGVLVLGAFINTGRTSVDVPGLLDVVVRDRDRVILGSGFLQTDYPILPPDEKIGFGSWISDVEYVDVDPERVTIDSSLGLESETQQVEELAEKKIEVERMEEVSRSEQNLVIECVVTNASGSDFEHGLDPRFSVWDAAGLYCGHAFANVTMRIPAGDTVRFESHSGGGMINPLEIARHDFTWTPWITPR